MDYSTNDEPEIEDDDLEYMPDDEAAAFCEDWDARCAFEQVAAEGRN